MSNIDIIERYCKEGRIDELFKDSYLRIDNAPQTYAETLAEQVVSKKIKEFCKCKEDRARVLLVFETKTVFELIPDGLTPAKKEIYLTNYDILIEGALIAIEASNYSTDKKILGFLDDERKELIQGLKKFKQIFSELKYGDEYNEVYNETIMNDFLTKDILSADTLMDLYEEGLVEYSVLEKCIKTGYSKILIDKLSEWYDKRSIDIDLFVNIIISKSSIDEIIKISKQSRISNESIVQIFYGRFFEVKVEEVDSAVKMYAAKAITKEQFEDIIRQGYFEYDVVSMKDIVTLYKSKKIDEIFMQQTFTPMEIYQLLAEGEIDAKMFVDCISEKNIAVLHEVSKKGKTDSYLYSVVKLLEIYKETERNAVIRKIPAQILMQYFLSPNDFEQYFEGNDNMPQINITDLQNGRLDIFKLAMEENEKLRISKEEFTQMYKKLIEYPTKNIKEEQDKKETLKKLLPQEEQIKILYEKGFLTGQDILDLYRLNDIVTEINPVNLDTLIHIYKNQQAEKEGNIQLGDIEEILDAKTIYKYCKENGISDAFREFYNEPEMDELRKKISCEMCEYIKGRGRLCWRRN